MSELMSLEAAREHVLSIVAPLPVERIPVADGLGRVVAEAAASRTDLPPWDNCAMDGYAVRSADLTRASEHSPVRLAVTGEVAAGSAPSIRVERGTAVRVATGAPLPEGADAVVAVEQTTPVDATGSAQGPRGREATGPLPAACLVHEAVAAGGSIRRRGEDLRAGTTVLEPGRPLSPAAIAIAAGAGIAEVSVHGRPRVGVLATGDEIRASGADLGPAGIPDANGPALRALVRQAGGEPIDLGIAGDRLDDVLGRLRGALPVAEVVIVSGGVSVGPYDVVREAFASIGHVDVWRVAVQPGKPFAFGTATRPDGGQVLLFGLPGNPVSTFVTFELFVRPALRRLAGRVDVVRQVDRGVLLDAASKAAGRRAFLRVRAERDSMGREHRDDQGRVRLRLAGGQGSHVLSGLAQAEALAVVREDVSNLPAGSAVEVWWLDVV